MKSVFAKSFIVSLSIWLAVFNTVVPLVAFAEETTAQTTTEATQTTESEPTPTPTPTLTPTPTPEPTTIETGNADSSATATSDANSAETEVPGSLTGEGCGPETTCPQDTTVQTEQGATTETSSDAQSTTGENEATTSGDLAIDTGDASSSATTVSQDNTNVVKLTEPSPAPSPSPEPEASLDVSTSQKATASAESSATSETGKNLGKTEGALELLTGDAWALATTINVANINLVGSDLIWLIKTILGQETLNVNLYEQFMKLVGNLPGDVPQETTITTDQIASLKSNTLASSDTGQNEASDSAVSLKTGDAAAVANTVNLANLNLVGSRGIFAVINIAGKLSGDIILPNSTHMSSSSFPWGNTQIITNQTAQIESGAESQSTTGENTLKGDGELGTGDATAVANTHSFANLVRVGDGWALLIFNVFGNWAGSLFNWKAPGTQTNLSHGTSVLEKEWKTDPPDPAGSPGGSLTVTTNQDAQVNSQTQALANTGQNLVRGQERLLTGNAFSLANDFTLANFVGVGSSFIFGVFNILGSWVGDLIMAYPDLEVSVTDNLDQTTPGFSTEYVVTVKNRGHARANGVSLSLGLSGEYNLSDGATLSWDINSLGPGESYSYNVGGAVSPTALAGTNIVATATTSNHDLEETDQNNTASDTTTIVLPQSEETSEGTKDTRLPNLAVSVWHNVGEYVYPGDTVLAEVTVANQSPFAAHEVKVEGLLSNDHPMPPIPMNWNLGDLRPGERVKIEFQINLINEIPDGMYHLAAQAKGKSEAGKEASSGWIVSDFLVRLKNIARILTPEVLALESNQSLPSAETLGVGENKGGFDIRRYFLYILAASIPVLLALSALRRKINGQPLFPAFLLWKKRKNEENQG